jgi:hypothetical protein
MRNYLLQSTVQKLSDIEEVLDIIKQIPDKSYNDMVEVEKAVGAIR